jgi:hypothetical protein
MALQRILDRPAGDREHGLAGGGVGPGIEVFTSRPTISEITRSALASFAR